MRSIRTSRSTETSASAWRCARCRRQSGQGRADAARLLQIEGLLDRKPGQLSGGQRQRVAIGRALVRKPQVFLFDEPLSNLDAKLRMEMRTELKRLHQMLKTTVVYVTHDQIEAMTLATRIAVMKDGRIEQLGTPPRSTTDRRRSMSPAFVGAPPMNHALPVRIEVIELTGPELVATARIGQQKLTACLAPRAKLGQGDATALLVDDDALHLFHRASGRACLA
jgi:multiple sugar transport system ATP-binding protein